MNTKRMLSVLIAGLAGLLFWQFGFGALFPWSPIKPGYSSRQFAAGTVYFPSDLIPNPQYAETDRLIQEVQQALHLQFGRKVKVIVCSDWKRFNRGMLTFQGSHPQEVLGATLQTGDVIYLSPLLLEPQRDAARALKHELCHALLYQNTTLQNSFRLARVHWLIEGLGVSNGNAEDYLSAERWHALAVQGGYLFPIEANPHIERMPLSIGAPFMLSEYRFFIEFLVDHYGHERLQAYIASLLASAREPEQTFAKVYGFTLDQADKSFGEAVHRGEWPPLPEHPHKGP
jgi:hypothetical protein